MAEAKVMALDLGATDTPLADMARAYIAQSEFANAPEALQNAVADAFLSGCTAMLGIVMMVGQVDDRRATASIIAALKRELESHGAVLQVVDAPPEDGRVH